MIVRTEYSFRSAFGAVERVLERLPAGGIIADESSTWGFVPWAKACKAAGKAAGFGVRLRVSADLSSKGGWREVIVVATSAAGLRRVFELTTTAHAQFAFFPRLLPGQLPGPGEGVALVASGRRTEDAPPLPEGVLRAHVPGLLRGSGAAFSDNLYPYPEDRDAWAMSLGRKAFSVMAPGHIMLPEELVADGASKAALEAGERLLGEAAGVRLPRAENVRYPVPEPLEELRGMCRAEMRRRGLEGRAEYEERLERELRLVGEKDYADYFLVIADMISWAKARMLVGPGRGSSAGSLVCWLLRITEVDPLRHGLLFERFIDLNRYDLPDIDIDFPDTGRGSVLGYLAEKYGADRVAHIGTVMRFKARSALTDVAKELKVPPWELDVVKDALIERSSGDSRVNDCLRDTFAAFPPAKKLLDKYPALIWAAELEGRARQTGKHAAGMIVCNEPVRNFAAVNRDGVAQVEKKGAEALNILKIDALGLKALSVLDEAARLAGRSREEYYGVPLEDEKTLAVFNERRFAGIFQFEGNALRSLATQTPFTRFEDVAALTALARPGPLAGGEATRWLERKLGESVAVPPHPALRSITEETLGTILYQEQVMVVVREMGGFTWADTAAIRKLMSNRSGDESFRKFEAQFLAGAAERGVDPKDAQRIWDAINSFGSWAFNKSHAVVYGLVSWWCAWAKAHFPLEFAAATLRGEKDSDAAKAFLREMRREGLEFVPVDRERSGEDWEIVDGRLLGGLTGIKGIGAKIAREIIARRRNGIPLTPRHEALLRGASVFENVFPAHDAYGHLYRDPAAHGIRLAPLVEVVDAAAAGHCVVLGRVVKKSLRDMNEEHYVVRRGGKRMPEGTKMAIFHLEDDSGKITCIVNHRDYARLGQRVAENAVEGETWLMVRGRVSEKGLLVVEAVRWLKER